MIKRGGYRNANIATRNSGQYPIDGIRVGEDFVARDAPTNIMDYPVRGR